MAVNFMDAPLDDETVLLIRCPSCGQRFKVGDELRGRIVECGGCEFRFEISNEVIIRGPRAYPGDRKVESLNRFHRVLLTPTDPITGVQPMRYANLSDVGVLEPTSPLRILVGCVGVVAMISVALFLMFGGGRGGALDGMVMGKRLIMAGFTSLLGVSALYYANPRGRLRAVGIGLLLAVGLMAVPFGFKAGSVPLPSVVTSQEKVSQVSTQGVSAGGTGEVQEDMDTKALRDEIGTDPLVAEAKRLTSEGSHKRALGIWLRGLNSSNRFLVRDYILRVARADPTTHFYPRSHGDYLLVVTGVDLSLVELAEQAAALGEAEKIYPEIDVVEVRVNNEVFVEGAIEKLSDKKSPAFYDLNKRELESIDLERVKRAVQRLAEVEPKIYRADIIRKLIDLLREDGVNFKGNICKALMTWSEKPGVAGEAALVVLDQLIAKNETIAPEIVTLIVKEQNPKVIPVLDELWFKNPMDWEMIYGDLGPVIENTLIQRFPQTTGTIRYSAIRLLGRVGGSDSLPVLQGSLVGADAEIRVLVEQAKSSIEARKGQ
jgi:hypothetical protein